MVTVVGRRSSVVYPQPSTINHSGARAGKSWQGGLEAVGTRIIGVW
jgi:hypothetical protein